MGSLSFNPGRHLYTPRNIYNIEISGKPGEIVPSLVNGQISQVWHGRNELRDSVEIAIRVLVVKGFPPSAPFDF
jgi:hypothetical protein